MRLTLTDLLIALDDGALLATIKSRPGIPIRTLHAVENRRLVVGHRDGVINVFDAVPPSMRAE